MRGTSDPFVQADIVYVVAREVDECYLAWLGGGAEGAVEGDGAVRLSAGRHSFDAFINFLIDSLVN